jgi:hypothetical protein
MVQPQYNPQEALERVKLMMKYDTSKTLNENREIIFEQASTPGGIPQKAVDKIIEFSNQNKKNKRLFNTSKLTFEQSQEIDKEFGKDTYDKFLNNGGEDILNNVEKPQEQGKKIPEIPLPNGVSQQAADKIIAISKKNKESFRGSYLFPPQQQAIDAEFGTGTYIKFFENGGEEVLKGEKIFKKQTKPEEPSQSPYSKFPCVKKHRKAVKGKDVDGNDIYTINGVVYYGNGRKRLTNGTMANYTCNDPEFKGKSKPVEIPKVLEDAEGVMKFQDWLDNNHGDDKEGQGKGWATGLPDGKLSQAGGYGRFGPRTQKAWKNPAYKDGYLQSLQTPTSTTPDNTEGLADETEANSDQPF